MCIEVVKGGHWAEGVAIGLEERIAILPWWVAGSLEGDIRGTFGLPALAPKPTGDQGGTKVRDQESLHY